MLRILGFRGRVADRKAPPVHPSHEHAVEHPTEH
jgi:hypothetical protein